MNAQSRVGLFSFARWGVGGTILVLASLGLGFVTIYEWYRYHVVVALVFAVFLFFAGGAAVFVKLTEEIEPMRYIDDQVLGKQGVVEEEVEPGRPGVVKIGYQSWSAKSTASLQVGSRVVVTGRDGVYLWVAPADAEAKGKEKGGGEGGDSVEGK